MAAFAACHAVTTAHAAPLDAAMNERVVMVPAGLDGRTELETTLFKPDGDGPFPLLVINHGKSPGDPHAQPRDRFIYMATAFVRRGYAVMVPMRTGFARSTGRYADHGCNMTANGMTQAADIADAIRYARRQPWIDGARIVVAGQSYGGLATMALAARNVPGVRGVMNFAGGLKIHGNTCDWQNALVHAYAKYGRASMVASLWLYGANDSYFDPALASRMHAAYVDGGGDAELLAYGNFKNDAHTMLGSRDGEKIWLPAAERFLRRIGMPADDVVAIAAPPAPAATRFATLDDVGAIPYLPETGREQYRRFLSKQMPRAFAVSASGAWGWAEEGEDPNRRALAACQSQSRQPCHLYSVDTDVVWPAGTADGRTD